jgi:mannose-6-phosphate isomerase-like protein (cupin superfamily)
MSLLPNEEIGNEVHKNVDQFFRIEGGEAKFVVDNGKEKRIAKNGDVVIIPAGTFHNIINNSKTKKLKLYTIYSPPNHPPGTIHKTKADAERAEH